MRIVHDGGCGAPSLMVAWSSASYSLSLCWYGWLATMLERKTRSVRRVRCGRRVASSRSIHLRSSIASTFFSVCTSWLNSDDSGTKASTLFGSFLSTRPLLPATLAAELPPLPPDAACAARLAACWASVAAEGPGGRPKRGPAVAADGTVAIFDVSGPPILSLSFSRFANMTTTKVYIGNLNPKVNCVRRVLLVLTIFPLCLFFFF